MTSLALGLVTEVDACPRMNHEGFLDDGTILLQLDNVATGIGQGNFVNLVGIQPDFTLSAFQNGRGKALLETEIDCAQSW